MLLDPLNQNSLPPAPPLPEQRGFASPSAEAPSSPSWETSYVPADFKYISIPNLIERVGCKLFSGLNSINYLKLGKLAIGSKDPGGKIIIFTAFYENFGSLVGCHSTSLMQLHVDFFRFLICLSCNFKAINDDTSIFRLKNPVNYLFMKAMILQ